MPLDLASNLIIAFLFAGIFAWFWAIIFKKAGYSPAMGLLMFIPGLNALTFLYFTFSEWPILTEIAFNRRNAERDRPTDRIDTMLRQAAALDQRGEWKDAANLFDTLAQELGGQAGSHFAAHQAKRIRQQHNLG